VDRLKQVVATDAHVHRGASGVGGIRLTEAGTADGIDGIDLTKPSGGLAGFGVHELHKHRALLRLIGALVAAVVAEGVRSAGTFRNKLQGALGTTAALAAVLNAQDVRCALDIVAELALALWDVELVLNGVQVAVGGAEVLDEGSLARLEATVEDRVEASVEPFRVGHHHRALQRCVVLHEHTVAAVLGAVALHSDDFAGKVAENLGPGLLTGPLGAATADWGSVAQPAAASGAIVHHHIGAHASAAAGHLTAPARHLGRGLAVTATLHCLLAVGAAIVAIGALVGDDLTVEAAGLLDGAGGAAHILSKVAIVLAVHVLTNRVALAVGLAVLRHVNGIAEGEALAVHGGVLNLGGALVRVHGNVDTAAGTAVRIALGVKRHCTSDEVAHQANVVRGTVGEDDLVAGTADTAQGGSKRVAVAIIVEGQVDALLPLGEALHHTGVAGLARGGLAGTSGDTEGHAVLRAAAVLDLDGLVGADIDLVHVTEASGNGEGRDLCAGVAGGAGVARQGCRCARDNTTVNDGVLCVHVGDSARQVRVDDSMGLRANSAGAVAAK